MGGIVAIVGKPNVGKSTLFNRLIGERKAIVDNVSGVTRDRHYGKSDWIGKEFTVIDTGGYVHDTKDLFEKSVKQQVEIAMKEADVLLFVVDSSTDPDDLDMAFAQLVRRVNKPTYLVANKADSEMRVLLANNYYSLGFDQLYTISAMTGSGTGDLLDEVVKHLPETEEQNDSDLPKIAFIGRPNVGKSTICNTLIGEERNIVTDIAGTTRDTIYIPFNSFNFNVLLVDTAGVRRRSRVHEDIEFYSVMRSIKALENADVVALIIDAERGLESQDMNLFGLAQKNGKGIVILVNKWDLVEKDLHSTKIYTEEIKERISPFVDIPILFVSAIEKKRILKSMDAIMEVYDNMQRRITTSELNEFFQELIQRNPPPSLKGKTIKIKYVTQLPTKCSSFAFFCNLPQYVPDSYKRFLENKLRQKYNYTGVPVRIYFRKK
jgi:GTPase